jgi:predicted ATPase
MTDYYQSDDEIRSLVNEFEACSFHPAEFRHHQHLAVVLWYVANLPFAEARKRMKSGIQRLAARYGKTGYHETITEFWLRMVRGFLLEDERAQSLAMVANQLIEKYADKNLILDYYSAELLASPQAKSDWVAPDVKPIPFPDY